MRSVVSHNSPAGPLGPQVLQDLLLGLVGNEAQRELAQCGEILRPEEPVQGGGDLGLRVDVPVQHAAAELIGGRIDQLELIGTSHHPIGHPLAHSDAGDPLDGIGQGLDVLDVDRRDHRDARIENLEDVLPTLLVATRARHVGVRQFVDQHHLGLAGNDGIDVHLLPIGVAVMDLLPRHHRKVSDLLDGVGALVRLDESDHHVSPALEAPPSLVEHGAGLAHAGRRAEVDPELARRAYALVFTRAQVHDPPCFAGSRHRVGTLQ